MPKSITLVALTRIKHDGKLYAECDVLKAVPEQQALALVASGSASTAGTAEQIDKASAAVASAKDAQKKAAAGVAAAAAATASAEQLRAAEAHAAASAAPSIAAHG